MTKTLQHRLITAVFFSLVIFFFVIYLRDIDFNALSEISVNWLIVLIASIVAMGFRYWGVFIWQTILQQLGAKSLPSFSILSGIYAKAWMGRYIPGKVTWIAGKVYFASKYGISKSRLTVSSLLEGGMQIVAITIVSLFLMLIDTRLDIFPTNIRIFLLAVTLGLTLILHPKVFNRTIRFFHKKLRNKEAGPELSINKSAVVKSFILYSIGAIISGTSYFLLTYALVPDIHFENYLFLVGSFNLAGAIGMAALITPSGLGVRDGILLILLSVVLPREIALVVTIASRLWSSLIDVFFYVISQYICKRSMKKATELHMIKIF
jgi:glycosyltransferase 2 family protein